MRRRTALLTLALGVALAVPLAQPASASQCFTYSSGDLRRESVLAVFEGRIADRWGPDDTFVAPAGGGGLIPWQFGYDSFEDQHIEFAVDRVVAGELPDRFVVRGWQHSPCWDPEPGELLAVLGPVERLSVKTITGPVAPNGLTLAAGTVVGERVPWWPHPITAIRLALLLLPVGSVVWWRWERSRRRRRAVPGGSPP